MNQPDAFTSPTGLNARMDDIYRHLQELEEKADRSFKGKGSTATADFELPEVVADKYLGWNTGGTALENKNPIDITFTVKKKEITIK